MRAFLFAALLLARAAQAASGWCTVDWPAITQDTLGNPVSVTYWVFYCTEPPADSVTCETGDPYEWIEAAGALPVNSYSLTDLAIGAKFCFAVAAYANSLTPLASRWRLSDNISCKVVG